MIRVIGFDGIMFFLSGMLLLTVDRRIYKTEHKNKEATYSSLFGWINLSGALVLLLIFLWLR
ncbi:MULTISPECIES: CLC_0170 family protein [Paenibacillus]|uniref:Uncharacterized protein n=1 Tax=Paenibacillus vini TaxID=1476024 RepID=A0ABQ4MG02_9BACL|nr:MULTISPECIES: CLC_0170 family protein [Paenibacillus]MBQ4899493.1 hypothetical protein [Paenibacillus sp. Marseille-P2973]GIP54921.1 hypothetical protein J42TS3_39560 [Paenibacillus vini]